jgi:oligoendopeptidase F
MERLKTEWDFGHLLKEDFLEERKKIEKAYNNFRDKWKNNLGYLEKPEVLKEALDEYENLVKNYKSAEDYYFHLSEEKNQDDVQVRAKSGQISEFLKNLGNEIRFFTLSLGKVSKEKQNEFLESDFLREYKNFLKVLFENSKYHLKEGEEKILSLKSNNSYELWTRMVSSLLSKETREVLDESEKISEKTYPEMISLMQSQSQKVRDSSSKAFNEILDKYVEVAEFEINAILEDKKINDRLRGFERPDESRHKEDLIETEIVDALVESVSSKGFEISRKFYGLKSKLLKLPKINYYERAAQYGEIKKDFSYEKSVALVKKVFYDLDKKFGEIFESYLENGQIDVFPQKGKNGGAFCAGHGLKFPTYILLNHNGKLRDVTTLAHELGHGMNNEFMKEKQNALYFDTPKATAEVASTFMEDFVFTELLDEVGEEEKLAILMKKLEDDISSIMRQIALYNFEKELHETYRKENYLSKEKIGKIFRKNMENYMGDFVDCSEAENWWVYWPHIRYYFYVYSYSSGLLISKSMQKKVKENPKFIEEVKEFLSAGTSESPKEIFMKMGIDISDKEFWNKGLNEVESLLNETEDLARNLGKI